MSDGLKQKVVRGVAWRLAERFGTQAMSFVVGIVLARLLGPEAYGTIALLSIFIAVSGVLVDSGFGTALIQKKDATEADFNSVFYLSIGVSLLVYAGLFAAAPCVASFYQQPILAPVLRVAAIGLVLNAVNGVQNAVLARKMLFNLSFRISLSGTLSHGVIGITLAYLGYGVWALVWASLGSSLIATLVRWFLIGWMPRLQFSAAALKPLFGFSWKLLVSALLDSFFVNVHGLVIGRVYSPKDLALYNKGQSMPSLLMDSVDGTLGSVAFPALAQMQNDRMRLKEAMRKMIQVSTFFVMPLMAMLAAMSEPLMLFLYGEKWRAAIVFVQIACIVYAFWPFHTINLQGINAVGRSDVFLKLEIIKKALCLLSIAVVFKFGVVAFALTGALFLTPLSVLVNAWPNKKLLGYGFREQLVDVLPTMGLAVALFVAVWPLSFLPATTQLQRFGILMLQAICGVALSWLILKFLPPRAFKTLASQFPFVRKFV